MSFASVLEALAISSQYDVGLCLFMGFYNYDINMFIYVHQIMSFFKKSPPVFAAPIARVGDSFVLSGSFFTIHESPFHASVPDRHFTLRMQTYPTNLTSNGERIHVKVEWHHHDGDASMVVLKCTKVVEMGLDMVNHEIFTASINELLKVHSKLMMTIHGVFHANSKS